MGILSAFRFAFQNLFFTPILYGVIASLAVFSTVWEQGDRLKDQLTDRFRSQDDTFDFIIVGAGSSGAVLANRLSQFHTVLLLEAGGETHPFQAIPGLSIFIPKHPGTDWMHKSVTQSKSCLACRHKKYILSQGKNLGGTGNLNYMMHLRGNPLDFDNWATITSDPTWGYEGVLRYFIQSENFVGKTTDDSAHGHGGPLQIQLPDCVGLADSWNQAGVEMGYPHVDLNGRHSEGFDTVFYPIKHGVRQATYRSYIQPVRNRRSLLIRKFAHVNKVLIREGTNEAYGVEYDRHGHRKHAFANKEIILSAGTLQTPKLLVLSGVGQSEHLHALHIPARSILPVGKNLQDHISTFLGPFYINKARTISFDRDIDKQSFVSFATSGKGPLSTTGFQATAMIASSIARAQGQSGWPDIQLTLFGLTPHRMFYSDIGHAFGIREDILHRYYGDVTGKEKDAFFIMVTLARPVSKGDFCVPNKNPYRAPVIDPNYLSDPEGHDIKVLTEGIHRALFLAENSTVFRNLETWYSNKCFPGCEGVPFRSDRYWECYIRHFSVANNDHVGTCAMGQIGSPYAVVDPELQVQGIKRLRVVDASVMPTITGAPTQAATIMIAEKASALILDRWKNEVKTLYGPPGQRPGTPVSQYGPPGRKPGPPVAQYGPPSPPPSTQYGPPGLKPPPVAGGDGFSNYDSFSVIRDQLNPTTGPGPTQLIPLQPVPVTQVWSTAQPFPSSPAPPLAGIGSSTPGTLLSPEPSVLLVPPEQLPPNGPPPFATSYQTFSSDVNGPIVSTTPSYPVSLTLDTSRSEKNFVATNGDGDSNRVDINTTSSSRQGKAFSATGVPPLQNGNQLGDGFDDEIEDTTIPPAFQSTTLFREDVVPTTPTPAFREVTTEVLTQGPGFRVIRKRIRTTPRVVVHPRGHLGHQDVQRKPEQKFNETLESLFLTTSSIRPVPKEIVKIRRRRPVPFRRRTTTPVPFTTENIGETTFYPYDLEYSTTMKSSKRSLPSSSSSDGIPTELKSPGRKRFVRRMYARPLNFNGKRKFSRRNDVVEEATTVSPIFVTAASDVIEVTAATENDIEYDDNVDEDVTKSESDSQSGEQEENFTKTPISIDLKNETMKDPPIVIFKNIELEDADDLSRPTRSDHGKNKSYFAYNVDGLEEDNNPIMAVDLDPIPEIIAPKMDDDHSKTVAIDLSNEVKDDENEEIEGNTETPQFDDFHENATSEVVNVTDASKSIKSDDVDEELENLSSLTSDEISQISYSPNPNHNDSKSITFSLNGLSSSVNLNKSLKTESPLEDSTSISVSVSVAQEVGASYEDDETGASKELIKELPETTTPTPGTPRPTTVPTTTVLTTTTSRPISSGRFNFRLRNKLMRTHS